MVCVECWIGSAWQCRVLNELNKLQTVTELCKNNNNNNKLQLSNTCFIVFEAHFIIIKLQLVCTIVHTSRYSVNPLSIYVYEWGNCVCVHDLIKWNQIEWNFSWNLLNQRNHRNGKINWIERSLNGWNTFNWSRPFFFFWYKARQL